MPPHTDTITCPRCKGRGQIKCPGNNPPVRDIRDCPKCQGTDRVVCTQCGGTGSVTTRVN